MCVDDVVLCGGQVPVEPVLTTAAACGTMVESSLGSARLDCCSGVTLKRMLQTFIAQSCLKLCSSQQTQGVVGAALNRQRKL